MIDAGGILSYPPEPTYTPGFTGERAFEGVTTPEGRGSLSVLFQVLGDGSVAFIVGKKSELVTGFPVGPHSKPGTILHALNEREKGWGGGSTIGGSPRNADGSRSRLTPDEVFDLVESIIGTS